VGSEAADSLNDALLAEIRNLRAFATSLCGNRDLADDLVQETLVKAWPKLDTFEPGTNLRAWLFTILRNTYFTHYRKRQREVVDSGDSAFAALSVPPEQPGHMDMQDFRRALGQLSGEQREALILVGAAGLSYDEAAKVCGCAVGTVKSRVSRARDTLAEILDAPPGGDAVEGGSSGTGDDT